MSDWAAGLFALLVIAWGTWSYFDGGLVSQIMAAAGGGEGSLDRLRAAMASTGPWAPAVYVAAVVFEVLVAPIPGTLLYAPGGALFGGWYGGTLSLVGNVAGAALATWIASRFRSQAPAQGDGSRLLQLAERIRDRGVLVVALLRVNPLTSSDLVSYAAGLVGIAPWRVAAGTLVGLAPLCYAQAHAAEWLFGALPGAGAVLVGFGLVYLVLVLWLISRHRPGARRAKRFSS
jgi:uncharacterized membrane protein YdjX (TVP38/TMEM64 family)